MRVWPLPENSYYVQTVNQQRRCAGLPTVLICALEYPPLASQRPCRRRFSHPQNTLGQYIQGFRKSRVSWTLAHGVYRHLHIKTQGPFRNMRSPHKKALAQSKDNRGPWGLALGNDGTVLRPHLTHVVLASSRRRPCLQTTSPSRSQFQSEISQKGSSVFSINICSNWAKQLGKSTRNMRKAKS